MTAAPKPHASSKRNVFLVHFPAKIQELSSHLFFAKRYRELSRKYNQTFIHIIGRRTGEKNTPRCHGEEKDGGADRSLGAFAENWDGGWMYGNGNGNGISGPTGWKGRANGQKARWGYVLVIAWLPTSGGCKPSTKWKGD